MVNKNSPIILVENTAVYNDVFYLKEILENAIISKDSINFPVDTMPILLLGEIQKYYSSFEKLYLDNKLSNRYNEERINLSSAMTDVGVLKGRLNNLENKLVLDYKKQKLLKNDQFRIKKLFEKGVISKQEYEEVSIKEFEGRQRINDTKADINNIKFQINNSNKNFQLNDAKLNSSTQSLSKALVHSYNQLQVAIKEWENKYLISAPRRGIISFNQNYTKNDFLDINVLIGSVINENNVSPEVHLFAPITNSGKINIKQQVNLKFHNYDYIEYGIVYGKIQSISNIVDKNNKYLIKVKLENGLISSYNKQIPFKSDISCTGDIIVERKTFFEKIFYQFKDILYNH